MYQYPGLARAGSGQHQHVALRSTDRLALGRVQMIENRRNVIHGERCCRLKLSAKLSILRLVPLSPQLSGNLSGVRLRFTDLSCSASLGPRVLATPTASTSINTR